MKTANILSLIALTLFSVSLIFIAYNNIVNGSHLISIGDLSGFDIVAKQNEVAMYVCLSSLPCLVLAFILNRKRA